ncbi:MAG TPA: SRPBCC family protein [Acidimicrobiales bacterium]|jgi:mxaD protein
MPEVHEVGELGSSVDGVWKLVGDFGGMVSSMGIPVELEGEGIGQTRTISMGAVPTVERLEALDDDGKRLQYSMVASALPVANYLSTIQLSPAGEGRTKVDWSSTFDVTGELSEEEGVRIVSGIYKGGIAAMQARFGA